MTALCENHTKEINRLRKKSHKTDNTVSVLQAVYDDNCKDIDKIKLDIGAIKENHLQHIEGDIRELKTDVSWIKRIQWFSITTSIATLLAIVVNTYLTFNK